VYIHQVNTYLLSTYCEGDNDVGTEDPTVNKTQQDKTPCPQGANAQLDIRHGTRMDSTAII
jgi:hypothetical protein